MALWDKVGCPVKLVTLCEGVATIPHSRYLLRVTVKQPHTVFYMYSATYTILESSCNILAEQQHTAKSTKWKTCCKVQSRIQLQLHYTCCVRVTHAAYVLHMLRTCYTCCVRVTYAEYVLHKLCMCYKCCVCYISCICVTHAAYVLHKLCMRYACCCTANAVLAELSTTSTKCQEKM